MLSWLRRKKPLASDRPVATGTSAPAAAPAPSPPDRAAWRQRLDAARGDEGALLELARSAPLLEFKLAAVEALSSETALKQAERAFRSHDRKVHQLARQRLAGVAARRETQAKADAAIAAAQALLETAPIAANRLAELDRGWGVLASELVDAAQREAYAALRKQLDAALSAQDEARRAAQWREPAAHALGGLELACAAGDAARIETGISAVRARLDACPPGAAAAQFAQTLQAGLDAAHRALDALAEAARAAPPPPPVPAAAAARPKRADGVVPGVDELLQQAEDALAAGSSGELSRQLQAIDGLLAQHAGTALPARARARLQALHAERQRLAGWQRWGGAVAREGLVDEAEALARATAAAQAEPPQGKLNLQAHGEAIRKLRARWKELDRTGAAAGQALWLRFDAALTLAHAPVAAQQAALKAAREDNLAAREALLATLETVAGEVQPPRAALLALQDFQLAWRKLGPLAHTVPAAAVDGLQARVAALTARIEAPLAEARAAAQRERETLVERAEALAAQDDARDAAAQWRQLQFDWQQHARALPLPRAVEAALWARFRQAGDALAARREAEQQARDAEAASGIAAREALLQRLDALAQDAALDAAALARALGEVDRAWRELYTPLPRAVAEGIEARFLDARQAAAQAAETRRHGLWLAQCDALSARLVLCEEREAAPRGDAAPEGDAADAIAQRWSEAPPLPAAWQRALDLRWSGASPTRASADATDDAETLLLRLEDALGVAPAAAQAQARRELKLRALKEALESRAPPPAASEPRHNADGLAALLLRRDLADAQRERLRAVIDAMRGAPQKFDAG